MDKIKKHSDTIENTFMEDCKDSTQAGINNRKRSKKRKNKNIKAILGQSEGQDEQMFNDGDGLIDSGNENEARSGIKDAILSKFSPDVKIE
jgi:hypothetical protein